MKILVAISNVPDTTSKISFSGDGAQFNSQGVQFIINPYDEWYALVRALELKEAGKATIVTLFHVGPVANEATIRKGLALGADDAVRVNAESPDAFFVAAHLADYAKESGYDLIFTGKETIQYNGSAVAGIVAGILDLPFISLCTKLEIGNGIIEAERELEGGSQKVECKLPAVVSCAKGMAEQRIPNMRGIMAARTKAIKVVDPKMEGLTSMVHYASSPGRTSCKFVAADQVEELVKMLRAEAKVI